MPDKPRGSIIHCQVGRELADKMRAEAKQTKRSLNQMLAYILEKRYETRKGKAA